MVWAAQVELAESVESAAQAGLVAWVAQVESGVPAAWVELVVQVVLAAQEASVDRAGPATGPRNCLRARERVEQVTVLHNYQPAEADAMPGSTILNIAAVLPTATARPPTGSAARHAEIPSPTARPAPGSRSPVRAGGFPAEPG